MSRRVLNLNPMIRALSFAPGDFARLDNGDVRHQPSMHLVHFNWYGGVALRVDDQIVHECDCVSKAVTKRVSLVTTRAQRRELKAATLSWVTNYWEPKLNIEAQQINEHFAGHFDPASAHFREEQAVVRETTPAE